MTYPGSDGGTGVVLEEVDKKLEFLVLAMERIADSLEKLVGLAEEGK